MRIRLAIPDHLVTPEALEAALEATTLANQAAIEQGEIPLATEAISGGVKWREEPFIDGEHFDLGHQVAARGWGDCDDLAPWLAAELRATGDDEGARTRIVRTGPQRWHAVTETSDGQILDPSRWAGMGRRSSRSSMGVHGTVARPFAHQGGGAIACLPGPGGWWARCDLPFGDVHLASHARARSPETALVRAVSGAMVVGETFDGSLLERAHAAASVLLDDPPVRVGGRSFIQKFVDQHKNIRKDWERMVAEKGYTKENPPPSRGPDSWHDYGIAHGLHEGGTGFGSAVKWATGIASKAAAPVANVMAPGSGTMLSALARGGAGLLMPPEGGQTIRDRRTGAVSVPLESPDMLPDHGQHMFLMYHPLGNPGPVVMRF